MWFGRATASKDVDVVRFTYRRPLEARSEWWWPTHVQFGAGIWRVPGIGGITRRFDLAAKPVWRFERGRAYFEAAIGPHLLSRTINNETTHLPTALQFGTHLAAGVRINEDVVVAVALQHLSNAGIKEPNGGIDFVMLTASFPL